LWLIVLVAVIPGALTAYRAKQNYVPQYSTSAVFSVRAAYYATTDIVSESSYMNQTAAQTLSATFPYVIQSENTRLLLQKAMGMDEIPGVITARDTAGAALFTLTVTGRDPALIHKLLLAVIEVYPQAASNILGDTRIQVINLPTAPPTQPINEVGAVRQGIKVAIPVILAGLALCFLLALGRKTVNSAEDLRKFFNMKCLAHIPSVKHKRRSGKKQQHIAISNPNVSTAFREMVRSLRIKLEKAMEERNAKVLLISSTVPDEGKSTIAANLALSMAAEGHKVLLVDGDLRKQSLKDLLGVREESEGLTELLSGHGVPFRPLAVPGSKLLLLSGDQTSERPQVLLDSPRVAQLLNCLREQLDYVIIDTPPAGMLSDAATLSKYADVALYVIRQDLAAISQISDSLEALSSMGIPVLGCVLNYSTVERTQYGYYGYGEEGRRKKD
jgi:capsular exopolysaccharide synthesis family protein